MPNINHVVLRDVAFHIFRATGLPEEDARIISDHLADSNLCGHDSHGVWLVPRYVGSMRDGYVGWDAHEVVRENATLAIIKNAEVMAINRGARDLTRASGAVRGCTVLNPENWHQTHIRS